MSANLVLLEMIGSTINASETASELGIPRLVCVYMTPCIGRLHAWAPMEHLAGDRRPLCNYAQPARVTMVRSAQVCTGVMLHGYPLVKSLCGDLQVRTL